MPSTISPNMSLILPTVGQEPGPNWALDLNSSLSLVDQHNHSAGSGVQITPAGLNINTDLSIQSNNLTQVRSSRFISQIAPLAAGADIGCVYVSGADLYYNDTVGNQVRLTIAGAVNGTPGSIGGLVAPATATYVPANQAFVWQSNVNTSASMDAGPVTIRNNTAASNGITLAPPTPLPGNYTITLPASTPVSTGIVEMAATGVVSVNTSLYPFLNPVGAMLMFAGSAAPTGWLVCDGSIVSQATYANLFAVIGTAFNTGGEGAGNFRLPDMRRRVPMGAGGAGTATIGNLVGNTGGEENHTLITSEIPSHTHNATTDVAGSHKHDFTVLAGASGSNQAYSFGVGSYLYTQLLNTFLESAAGSHTHTITVDPTGGGTGHNTIQPSLIVNYIIKF